MSGAGERGGGGARGTGAGEPPFAEVEALFARVRRAPAPEREALLAEAPAAVRDEVTALLETLEDDGDSFLDRPALGDGFRVDDAAAADSAAAASSPRAVGRFRVLGRLGEGGMGTVYLAEQDHPRRTVALKVIRAGTVTSALRRRFEREAEVLARLRHPGIAQVYDAGVGDDGLPYIAMELVQGRSLLDHAHAASLGVGARLELFARVCDAIDHAHARGVVHRDLKPGNILVEGPAAGTDGAAGIAREGSAASDVAQPKILDFGVARVADVELRSATLQTLQGQLVGTIDYMSPEQAAGRRDDVDARSDVYALGLILYELLTGRRPYDLSGRPLHEAVLVIRDDEPAPLGRAFADDLDTIVGKALEKDRERRYASAAALAADVRRHLADQPILAHPPSRLYQLRKFARRHRVLVAVGGVAAASLLVGLLAVLAQWNQTRAARDVAEDRSERLRSLADDFLTDVDGLLLHVQGALPARRRIVEIALEHLDPLATQAGDSPDLLVTLVRAYARVGDIQGLPGVPNLGDVEGASASWARALDLLERVEALTGGGGAVELDRHNLLARLGDIARAERDDERALELYGRAQDAWRAARAADVVPDDAPLPLRARVAEQLIRLGRAEEGEAELEFAAEEARRRAAARPDDPSAQRDLLVALLKRTVRLTSAGAHEDALALFAEAASIGERLCALDPHDSVYQRDLATAHANWRDALLALGRREEAVVHHASATVGYEALHAAEPADARALMDLAGHVNRSGEMALDEGRLREALEHFERFDTLTERLAALVPPRADHLRRRGVALYKLGEVNAALAADEARPDERRASWATARDAFGRCLEHFVDMRERGRLAPVDEGVPDAVRARIAECEEALAGR